MTQSGIALDIPTYNTMIGVCCIANPCHVDLAYHLLDDMVFSGTFPYIILIIPCLRLSSLPTRWRRPQAFLKK